MFLGKSKLKLYPQIIKLAHQNFNFPLIQGDNSDTSFNEGVNLASQLNYIYIVTAKQKRITSTRLCWVVSGCETSIADDDDETCVSADCLDQQGENMT